MALVCVPFQLGQGLNGSDQLGHVLLEALELIVCQFCRSATRGIDMNGIGMCLLVHFNLGQ